MSTAKRKNIYPNPKFENLEQEEKYWATHSPLKERYEATVQNKEQKRSSFLTIRFTAEELTHLRDFAAQLDMKPSSVIRLALKNLFQSNTSNRNSHQFVPIGEPVNMKQLFGPNWQSQLKKVSAQSDKEFNNSFYIMKSSEFHNVFIKMLKGVQQVTPEDKYYNEIVQIAEGIVASKQK